MEGCTEGAAVAHTFSQVIFVDIPHSYPPLTPATCSYTLTPTFQPSPKDWVGIFKVGWNTTKDYHSYVWVEQPCLVVDEASQPVTKQAVFDDVPKDDTEFYQFCYVDKTGQVRGASTPFCFKNQKEQSMESIADDDLLLIMTQEQVEQSAREKAELMKSLDQMKEENETLRNIVQAEREKVDSLKKELVIQMTKQLEIQQNAAEKDKQNISLEETLQPNEPNMTQKYNRAVMKVNQLKQERDELKAKNYVQNAELVALKTKVKEDERELFKAQSSLQLREVDLQTSDKEKERLFAELQRLQSITNNMHQVKKENQELCRRLSENEIVQSVSNEEQKRCQTLHSKLQDAEVQLAAEREASKSIKNQAAAMQRELLHVQNQLGSVMEMYEEMKRRNSKLELLLAEMNGVIAEKDGVIEEREKLVMIEKREKDELCSENQSLRNDIEALHRMAAELQMSSPPTTPAVTLNSPPGRVSATELHREDPDEQESQRSMSSYEDFGNTARTAEQLLSCRHCQENFPGITRDELELHEQSHRVCPFCTLICDTMEQLVFEDHVYGHEL